MQPTEQHILKALELLEEPGCEIVIHPTKTIKKVYEGYIASFGASVIQSGLLTTAMLYCAQGDDNGRKDIAAQLLELYKRCFGESSEEHDLLPWLRLKMKSPGFTDQDEIRITSRLLQMATALKLAMRTFQFN